MTGSNFKLVPKQRIYGSNSGTTYTVISVDDERWRAMVKNESTDTIHTIDIAVLHHAILVGNARILGDMEIVRPSCTHPEIEEVVLLTSTWRGCKLCGTHLPLGQEIL